MSVIAIVKTVKRDLALPHAALTFAEIRGRVAEVAPYDSPVALLGALEPHSSAASAPRHALVSALVAENQRPPAAARALCQSLLLAAFEGMLVRLRARVGRPRDDDMDQRVLTAFLGAVAAVRVGPFTPLAIRWATEGELFASIRAERRCPETLEYDDDTHPADVFDVNGQEKAAALEIVRIIEAHAGEELLDVILATKASDESLKDYVARTRPHGTAEERAAEYGRLLRARGRLLARLESRVTRRGKSSFAA